MPLTMWHLFRRHFLALLGSLLLVNIFATTLLLNGYKRAQFSDMIEGQAYRPYAYRALYPTLIRVTSEAMSPSYKARLTAWGNQNPWVKERIVWNQLKAKQTPALLLFLGLSVLSFYGFLLTMRALVVFFAPQTSQAGADGWMFFAALSASPLASIYFYVYDAGVWLTFPLTLLFMLRRQWGPFFLAFCLCTLNKETSLLLIPLLYLWTKEESGRYRFFLLAFTGLIWLVTFSALRYTYRFNRGGFLEFHLIDQWQNPYLLKWILPFLVMVSLFSILIASGWKQKPLILRQGLLWTFLPVFFLMLIFGYAYELRDYYETFPFAYLLSIPTMQSLFNRFRSTSSAN